MSREPGPAPHPAPALAATAADRHRPPPTPSGAPVEDAIPSGQWSIAGKHVVITGPTSGIGKEAARQLAARGAVVVLAARRTDAAAALAAEIREQHPRAEVVVGPRLDLSSVDSVRQFAEQYRAQGRPLHVLVGAEGGSSITLSGRVQGAMGVRGAPAGSERSS